MSKLSFGKVLDCLCPTPGSSSCFCTNSSESQDEFEKKPLMTSEKPPILRLRDVISGNQTLAFQLKPKMVVLRVSMHCNACARKVEKHVSKLEEQALAFLDCMVLQGSNSDLERTEMPLIPYAPGVTSYKVDLESKMVVVTGDIVPFEVLESVSKVKNAELWNSPS